MVIKPLKLSDPVEEAVSEDTYTPVQNGLETLKSVFSPNAKEKHDIFHNKEHTLPVLSNTNLYVANGFLDEQDHDLYKSKIEFRMMQDKVIKAKKMVPSRNNVMDLSHYGQSIFTQS